MKPSSFCLIGLTSTLVLAKELPSSVWTSIGDVSQQKNGPQIPQTIWDMTVNFTITADMSPGVGDTFTLQMPNIYKVYGDAPGSTSISIPGSDGQNTAECSLLNANSLVEDTTIICTLTDENINNLVNFAPIDGSLNVPFIFNVGGSASEADLEAASAFHAGTNTFTVGPGLTATVEFVSGPSSVPKPGYNEAVDPVYYLRTGFNGMVDSLFVSGACPASAVANWNATIQFSGLSNTGAGNLVSCSNIGVYRANQFNDFSMPVNAEPAPEVQITCNGGTANFLSNTPLPAGYRYFVTAKQQGSTNGVILINSYYDNVQCVDNSKNNNKYLKVRAQAEGLSGYANVRPFVIVTETYSGAVTTFSSTYGEVSETFYVLVPTPRTTVTVTGSVNTMYTLPHASDATFLTVEVEVPTRTVTTTVLWTGSVNATTTVLGDDGIVSIVFENPTPTVTITSYWDNIEHSTTTFVSNEEVIVELFEPSTVTTTVATKYWSGETKSIENLPFTTDATYVSVIDWLPFPRETQTTYVTESTTLWSTATFTSDGETFLTVYEGVPRNTTSVYSIAVTPISTTFTMPWDNSQPTVTVVEEGCEVVNNGCGNQWWGILCCEEGSWCDTTNPEIYWCRPVGITTITSVYGGSTTSVQTLPYQSQNTTVIEYIPTATVTTTSVWNGIYTTYTIQTGESTATLVEIVPSTTTLYSTWDLTDFSTTTFLPVDPSSGYTIEVFGPQVSTQTSFWTGYYTSYSTNSAIPTEVTIIDYLPMSRTTVTRAWTLSTTGTTTFQCGDLEVANPTNIVFNKRDSEDPYTAVCDPYAPETALTIVVHEPVSIVLTTEAWTGSTTATSTVFSDGALTETLAVQVPNSVCQTAGGQCATAACCVLGYYCGPAGVCVPEIPLSRTTVTNYGSFTGNKTVTTVLDGMTYSEVIVTLPYLTTTVTKTIGSESATTTEFPTALTEQIVTVVVDVPTINQTTVTIFTAWTGTTNQTITQNYHSTDSTVTVEIDTPLKAVTSVADIQTTSTFTTVFVTETNISGSTTSTVTTIVPTVPGQNTATVVVDVPQSSTTTVTFTSGSITSTITTIVPTVPGQNTATVVVDVPQSSTTTVTFTSGSITSTVTTIVPTVPGQNTATVVVDVPTTPVETVTETITSGSITSTITTIVASVPGQNNTVVVQVPTAPVETVTETITFGSITSTITTITPSAPGQNTATVIIQVPSSAAPFGFTNTTSGTVTSMSIAGAKTTVLVPPPIDTSISFTGVDSSSTITSTFVSTSFGVPIVSTQTLPDGSFNTFTTTDNVVVTVTTTFCPLSMSSGSVSGFTTVLAPTSTETLVVPSGNPSGSIPSGNPSGSVPSGSVPSGSVPSGSVPSGSAPSGSASSGSAPSGNPSGSFNPYTSISSSTTPSISVTPPAQFTGAANFLNAKWGYSFVTLCLLLFI